MRQLTEKRIVELNESLTKTKEEYQYVLNLVIKTLFSVIAIAYKLCVCSALKKEIEQLEKGELDDNIPAMWAQMNA